MSIGESSSSEALPMISNVDFTLASGERVAICGPSGRGKSTFCKLLAGYLEPASGQILLDGKPAWGKRGVAGARERGLGGAAARGAARIQLISQHPEAALDPHMRIGKNLAEAGLKMRDDIPQMLGIDPDWERRFPLELSGGQLQRICIARAVASNPDFLIADEISTMLDALTQAQIWDFLLSWQEKTGAGLVFVSHSPALTERLATRTFDI
jgi:peptide/nickel transport system ATP-binding protein